MGTLEKKEIVKRGIGTFRKLEETDVLSPELYCKKVDILVEIYNLLVEEEIAWMQKSHENWLLKGDRNADYFHRIVNGRRRRNTIFSLSCGDEMIEGTKNLLKHATEFYKDLFGPGARNLCK